MLSGRRDSKVDIESHRNELSDAFACSSLVFEKAAKGDACGVLDRLGRTVEVYDRFPGLMRFDMG